MGLIFREDITFSGLRSELKVLLVKLGRYK